MSDIDIHTRVEQLYGDDGMERLYATKVIIFGVGGVGSWAAECLVRSGIINLTIVDNDNVATTNINRQLMATTSSVGQPKVDALKRRLLDINPEAHITALNASYSEATAESFHLGDFDYVIDAIDSLKDKVHLILTATRCRHTLLLSSMGAALKCDPTRVKVNEFWNVKGCPLARALRQRFKKLGTFPARKFQAVYSDELLKNVKAANETCHYKAQINGSLCHITAIFGMTLAGLIMRDLLTPPEQASR